jgi:hypothetical protein
MSTYDLAIFCGRDKPPLFQPEKAQGQLPQVVSGVTNWKPASAP